MDASAVQTKKSEYVGELYYENDILQFINHEEGRVIISASSPEYQYNLKDHLGNVRMTFTTKPDIDTDVATIEPSNYANENSNFLNVDDARKINSTIFDHTYNGQTPPTDGAYSQRLSGKAADGSTREVIGLAKSISVMPGDHIDMEVYAKYVDLTSSSLDQVLKTLVTNIAINAAPAGTVVDGLGYPTNTSSILPFPGLLAKSTSPSAVPKAYMNWLVFDRNYNLDMNKSGFAPITAAAKEDGVSFSSNPEGGAHEHLTASVDIVDPGYVYIWLSNDNDTPVEVYFDDFKVTQIKSPVVQTDDYYPFGLAFNSNLKENSLTNKNCFSNREAETDLSLNWSDFGARKYMADIGRFTRLDDFATIAEQSSNYNYTGDNPISFTDIGGDFRISQNFRNNYPGATAWLEKVLPKLQNNQRFLNTIAKHTNLDHKTIQNDLKNGNGPELGLSSHGDEAWGRTNGIGEITLNQDDMLQILENGISNAAGEWKDVTDLYKFQVLTTILHELVHEGSLRTGFKLPTGWGGDHDEGDNAEFSFFGRFIDRPTKNGGMSDNPRPQHTAEAFREAQPIFFYLFIDTAPHPDKKKKAVDADKAAMEKHKRK